jgi:hypothetical protein
MRYWVDVSEVVVKLQQDVVWLYRRWKQTVVPVVSAKGVCRRLERTAFAVGHYCVGLAVVLSVRHF